MKKYLAVRLTPPRATVSVNLYPFVQAGEAQPKKTSLTLQLSSKQKENEAGEIKVGRPSSRVRLTGIPMFQDSFLVQHHVQDNKTEERPTFRQVWPLFDKKKVMSIERIRPAP